MVVRYFIERLSKWLLLFICSYFLGLMYCCKLKQIFLFNSFWYYYSVEIVTEFKNLYNKIVFLDFRPCQFFIF